jgi:DMSO/TMAO reductase YedYZ molybdopterin-dependent catalytic subunit
MKRGIGATRSRIGRSELSLGGMIMRERKPLNLETPFGSLNGFITPSDHFFVRSHFSIPRINNKKWRLRIEGEVKKPLELSFAELTRMQTRTVPVTLECAGNGRAFLTPQVSGAQWERGAVGNAEWTGVPLSEILNLAGVRGSTRELILEGADNGEIKEPPAPAGKVHFARSLPIEKAMDDVLLAFQMNGEDLSAAHGSPLRAIVPGWYGMASVKWLSRIIATPHRFDGYYQTVDYAFWKQGPSAPTLTPITEMQIKAQIARPGFGDVVKAGRIYSVEGAAWTSEAEITKVEISTDFGATWCRARLLGKSIPNAWRLWDYKWKVTTKPRKMGLIARAKDSKYRTQPIARDNNRGAYVVNHLLTIEVEVQ